MIKIRIYFISLVIFVVYSLMYISRKHMKAYDQFIYSLVNKSLLKSSGFIYEPLVASNRCEPIKRQFVHYSVVFNGIKYPQGIPLYKNKSISFSCLAASKTQKLILAWNPFFGDYSYGGPFRANDPCPVKNCELTSDKTRLGEANLVLVHMRDGINEPPKTGRPSFQRWVFFLMESPLHSAQFYRYNGFFNLTSTYLTDSNFPYPYEADSRMIWEPNATFKESHDFYAGKLKFATAVISNCGASSRRLDYIKEMQKYVEVDVFGHCGRPCPTKFTQSSLAGDCKEILGQEYKFYLAFENSMCRGYITEKFFGILRYPIIPVVFGSGNYDHYVSKILFL